MHKPYLFCTEIDGKFNVVLSSLRKNTIKYFCETEFMNITNKAVCVDILKK